MTHSILFERDEKVLLPLREVSERLAGFFAGNADNVKCFTNIVHNLRQIQNKEIKKSDVKNQSYLDCLEFLNKTFKNNWLDIYNESGILHNIDKLYEFRPLLHDAQGCPELVTIDGIEICYVIGQTSPNATATKFTLHPIYERNKANAESQLVINANNEALYTKNLPIVQNKLIKFRQCEKQYIYKYGFIIPCNKTRKLNFKLNALHVSAKYMSHILEATPSLNKQIKEYLSKHESKKVQKSISLIQKEPYKFLKNWHSKKLSNILSTWIYFAEIWKFFIKSETANEIMNDLIKGAGALKEYAEQSSVKEL